MKKWFAFLLILALTLTSALALAEQTTITMSTWLATEDGTKAVYQEMLDDFMAANPDIKVEVIALPFNQNKDQYSKNRRKNRSGDGGTYRSAGNITDNL